MSVSPEDFLCLSKKLCDSQEEIDFRSAISRSYYGAYHCAVITAHRLELPEPKRSDVGMHVQLISRFEGSGPGLKRIARRLKDLKRLRAMADYQLSEHVSCEDARLSFLESSRLTDNLKMLGRATNTKSGSE